MAARTTQTPARNEQQPVAAPTDNLPAARPRATGVVAIQPQNWQEVTAIAGAICRARMAPKSYCDPQGNPYPDKVAIAILHGLELGMTPMAALQSLAVINGMPSVYGDGLVALVRASGLLEDIQEGIEKDEKTGAPLIAWCKVKRKGEASWKERALTWPEVMRAGWAGKSGPWTQTPGRMMQVRVRGWLLRDVFADVLRGLHAAEEVEDMVDVTPQGAVATTAPAAEPKREDYQKQQTDSAEPGISSQAPTEAGQAAEPATTAAAGAPTPQGDAGQPTADAKVVTDVADLNEQQQPVNEAQPPQDKAALDEDEKVPDAPALFENYKRVGDFFAFADQWLIEPTRMEAELVAFSQFYHAYMQERLTGKNVAVKEAMEDTKRLWQEALKNAQAAGR